MSGEGAIGCTYTGIAGGAMEMPINTPACPVAGIAATALPTTIAANHFVLFISRSPWPVQQASM